jgi:hypothetical protein
VRITGTVAKNRNLWADNFRHPSYFDLTREVQMPTGECEIDNAVKDGHVRLDRATGQVHGSFLVSDQWSCFQQGQGSPPGLLAGTYRLSIGCHACAVGVFNRAADTLPFSGPKAIWPLVLGGCAALLTGTALVGVTRQRRVM